MPPAWRLLVPAVALGGVAAEALSFGLDDRADWIPDLLTGWLLAGCGLIAWAGRPRSLVGPLLVATGALWFVGDVLSAAVYAYRGPLLQASLAYPTGRPRGRLQTCAVCAAYVVAVVEPLWRDGALTIVLSCAFVAAAAVHRRGAVGRERRERTYALGATIALCGLLAGTAAFRLAVETATANDASLLVFEFGLAALAGAMALGLFREPWGRARATDLVVELADTRSGALRDQLARALGDPTLEVGFPLGDQWVDAAGRTLTLPAAQSPRGTTPIEHDGIAVAMLIHDPAVLEDPAVAVALSEAARLSAANARLHAEVRAQIDELRASRRRLLMAADDERRRLEERLRDTAERRLLDLLGEVDEGRRAAAGDAERSARLERVEAQLEQSLADLRRLAAGLHPRELETGHLGDALGSLASRSPVPVELRLELPEGMSDELERTAYFICSEGLANVAKYAGASRASVTVEAAAAQLRVELADDGCGGANVNGGSGLRGLADRVEALGGTLRVESPPGVGTRIVADLPLTSLT